MSLADELARALRQPRRIEEELYWQAVEREFKATEWRWNEVEGKYVQVSSGQEVAVSEYNPFAKERMP